MHNQRVSSSYWSYVDVWRMLQNLRRNANLINQFTKRQIQGRYRGSHLGMIWSFIHPLFMLEIYTFIFGVVMNARWPQARTDKLSEFAVTMFAGLLLFNFFTECVNRAPSLIIDVPNYVKKVIFPLEIIPLSALGAAMFHALINIGILLGASILVNGKIPLTAICIPLVLLAIGCLSLGLTYFLAALGVFFRDIQQIVSLLTMALFFLTPIFYSVEIIPERVRGVIQVNPLTPLIYNLRRIVLWGEWPQWGILGVAIFGCAVCMLLGYAFFMRIKPAFADVI